MNNVSLIGRMTKDSEVRTTSNGSPVCSFCIAVDAGKHKANFIDCVAWGDKAQQIAKNFHKGDKIGISGQITTRMYEQDGKNRKATEVTVATYDFCESKKPEAESQQEDTTEEKAEIQQVPEIPEQPAGELPFEI